MEDEGKAAHLKRVCRFALWGLEQRFVRSLYLRMQMDLGELMRVKAGRGGRCYDRR